VIAASSTSRKEQDRYRIREGDAGNKKKVPGMGHRRHKTEDPRPRYATQDVRMGKEKVKQQYTTLSAKID